MQEVIKRFRWVIISFVIILLALICLVILYQKPTNSENLTDSSEIYETLNPHLSTLLESAEHKDYQSSSVSTRFLNTSKDYFYTTNNTFSTPITAFATAISILSDYKFTPNTISRIASQKNLQSLASSNLYKALAAHYGLTYNELPVMNHNILNYYLDNDYVVIIHGCGDSLYGESCNDIVVYASFPEDGLYFISSPTDSAAYEIAVDRSMLFSSLKSNESFHIFSGISNDVESFIHNDAEEN